MIKFFIPGTPQGKARARSARLPNGGMRHYTPEKTKSYEATIAFCASRAMKKTKALDCPVFLKLIIVMPIPRRWPKWKKELARDGKIHPTTKPDADNVEKAIKDGCNGIVWLDDCYVVGCTKEKQYTSTYSIPGVHVFAKAVNALPAQVKTKVEARKWIV